MNMRIFDRMPHIGRLCGKIRRGVAMTLVLAMVLPMTPALGVDVETLPVQSSNYPDIAIEGNFVRNEFGFLVKDEDGNGVFEMGLRVKSWQDPADTSVFEPFQAVNVSLEYDTSFLTPIDWNSPFADIDLTTATTYYETQLPTQKLDTITTAAAHSGIPTSGTNASVSTEVGNGTKALLTFTARSYSPVVFEELTTIAVIRFKVDKTEMEKISIAKDANGGYVLNYDDGSTVTPFTNVAEFQALTATATSTNGTTIMGFPSDDDIYATRDGSTVKMALRYESWTSEYYHVPAYDPSDSNTYTSVQETLGGTLYTMDKPVTQNDTVLAVDLSSASAPSYSYTTNLIVNDSTYEYITFPLVSKRSFLDTEDVLGNLTTIVYVDWDNTLLGSQIVPKKTDVRGLVSDYVAENFIYHDTDDTTYGPNDINNPQAAAVGTLTALDVVSSRARIYNYRGKYTATGPSADGVTDATTVTAGYDSNGNAIPAISGEPAGEDYPLTNKLDYVFFKRPMTYAVAPPDPTDTTKYPVGVSDPAYISDLAAWEANDSNNWVQKSETSTSGGTSGGTTGGTTTKTAIWDTEHPYAYGWALCTQESYADTWTTLGTRGELVNYAIDTDGLASVTYDGLNPDITFEFADLEQGFGEDDDIVVLKAVYEPGTDLMGGVGRYRMIKEPYYNKPFESAAAGGGAYSAEFTFERANNTDGGDTFVRGVPRIRMPAVRQEVTTDTLWETYVKDGVTVVDHDLPNATLQDLAAATKSTFIRVAVDNGETIDVSMTLSARQNKINYYLRDEYDSNFIGGSARTYSNLDMMLDQNATTSTYSTQWVVDNYNYYVAGQSYENDQWYDAPYADREGSYGFVLFGTLNAVMEKATANSRNQDPSGLYSQYVTVPVLNDANLRDPSGEPFTTANFYGGGIPQIILDAAKQAEDEYKNNSNDDWWNVEKDCAELTYHQLQYYIMTYNSGTGTLLSDATEANVIPDLKWCHLHKACADANSNKPTTWAELIDAARNDADRIDNMNLTEAKSITHLRFDSSGKEFDTLADFKSAIVDAVTALDGSATGVTTIYSWDQVQTQILGDSPANDCEHAKANYWWYDGISVSFSSLQGTIAAARPAIPGGSGTNTMPDGNPVGERTAKINQLESIWQANKDAVDQAKTDAQAAAQAAGNTLSDYDASVIAANQVTTAWRNATKNLRWTATIGGNPVEAWNHDTWEDFRDAFLTALKTVTDNGETLPDGADPKAYWQKLQFNILHGGTSYPTTTDQSEMDAYWWYDGDQKIVDIPTMLNAAIKNGAVWAAFTEADWVALQPDLYFAKNFAGKAFDTFADFKAAVKAVADNNTANTNLSWEQVQYLLIRHTDGVNETTVSSTTATTEGNTYYWWKDGNTTPPTMPHDTSFIQKENPLLANIETLITAMFRIQKNGIPVANSGLTTTYIEGYRLVKPDADGVDETDFTKDLVRIDSVTNLTTDLITPMMTLLNNARNATPSNGTAYTPPKLTWFQIQYALLNNGAYLPDGHADLPTDTTPDPGMYWWRLKDANVDYVGEILALMYKVMNGTLSSTDFLDRKSGKGLTLDLLQSAGLKRANGNVFNNTSIKKECAGMANIAMLIGTNTTLYSRFIDSTDPANPKLNFTLEELQYAINNYTDTAANILAGIDAMRNPASTSILLLNSVEASPAPEVVVETSEDGLTLTTTTTEKTYNQTTETWDKTITLEEAVTNPDEATVTTTKTVYLLTFNAETREPNMKILSRETTVTAQTEEADPEPTESTEPEVTETTDPEPTESTDPEATESADPEVTESTDPEVTESTDPEVTETAEPGVTESAEPEATESADPEATETVESEATETTDPEVTETTEPEPTESTEPEVTETTDPEVTESAEPEPTESQEPEPTETTEPEPTESQEPEPAESGETEEDTTGTSGDGTELLTEDGTVVGIAYYGLRAANETNTTAAGLRSIGEEVNRMSSIPIKYILTWASLWGGGRSPTPFPPPPLLSSDPPLTRPTLTTANGRIPL